MGVDLVHAGNSGRGALGRVVHFHALRKTFQTLGANSGMNQRAAQELLDHSDPTLTATVYTDVNALQLQAEVDKLPWIDSTAEHSQKAPETVCASSLGQLISKLMTASKRLGSVPLITLSQSVKLVARAVF